MSKNFRRAFFTTPNQTVEFELTIGDAQFGVSIVKLGEKALVESHEGSFRLSLGQAAALVGKELRCHTIVNDIRPEHDHTSVSYRISDGLNAVEGGREEEVQNKGAVAFYRAAISFR